MSGSFVFLAVKAVWVRLVFPMVACWVTSVSLEDSEGIARLAQNTFKPSFHPLQPKETAAYL